MYALISQLTLVCNMQLNVLDDLAEAMKAVDGKKPMARKHSWDHGVKPNGGQIPFVKHCKDSKLLYENLNAETRNAKLHAVDTNELLWRS